MAKLPHKLKFSPSHSERWMNCPGALALCATIPTPASSKHAMEGTAAHELGALCLEQNEDACQWIGETIEVEDKMFKVTEEMADAVQVYLDAVRGDLEENGLDYKELAIEKQFQLEAIPAVKGTNDSSFSSPLGKLYVYDYKHGQGTYVEVEENPQLMIYAIGAMQKAGWVNEEVEIVIAQPRYRDEEVAPVRRWVVTKLELCAFIAKLKNAIAECQKKDAKLCPGTWCAKSFCPAQGICPALRDKAVAVVDNSVTTLNFPDPAKLSPEEIAKVLEASGMISSWAKEVHAYAKRQAEELGVQIPGHKLVAKKGRRAWTDEVAVENEFEHEFGDDIYDKKLKSPAKLEKVVGKDRVKELVSIPNRGVELVPESAKGEAVVASAGQVFNVIK